MAVEPSLFVQGMRKLAAGVTVIATVHEGRRAGLTATAVCSVSADPPQLLACVNRAAEAFPLIVASGIFSVNVLSSEHRELAERFSGRHGHVGEDRFDLGDWRTLVTGAPILEICPAEFDCRVVTMLEAGTHAVFLAVVEAERDDPGLRPIVYHEGDFGLLAPLER